MIDASNVQQEIVEGAESGPELSPEQLAAATTLALALIEHAEDLTAAVAAIASGNTAKAPLQLVDTAVQAGAATVVD